ncbi:hypothetical protein Ciccas_005605 [Cichlidogyrus casuarinus]|uniref:Uncharacterized protein n=1 Tax=Cichlidogyrus casuarinus TaxID=1844966 RepID=A0ABD2Q979_9PLAT
MASVDQKYSLPRMINNKIQLAAQDCALSNDVKSLAEEFYHKYQCNDEESPLVRKWLEKIHKAERELLKKKFHDLYAKIERDPTKVNGSHGDSLTYLLCINAMKAVIALELTSNENLRIFHEITNLYDDYDENTDDEEEVFGDVKKKLKSLKDLESELQEMVHRPLDDIKYCKNILTCELKSDDHPVEAFVQEYEDDAQHEKRVDKWMDDVKTERHQLIEDFDKVYTKLETNKGKFKGDNEPILIYSLCILALKAISGLELCSDNNLKHIDDLLDELDQIERKKVDCNTKEITQKVKDLLNQLESPCEEVLRVKKILEDDLEKVFAISFKRLSLSDKKEENN